MSWFKGENSSNALVMKVARVAPHEVHLAQCAGVMGMGSR